MYYFSFIETISMGYYNWRCHKGYIYEKMCRTIQWYICYLKQGVVRRSAKISRYLFGKAGTLIGRRRNSKPSPHNAQKNRLREKGGEGSGPSRHTGGSRTHREHARQLVFWFLFSQSCNFFKAATCVLIVVNLISILG